MHRKTCELTSELNLRRDDEVMHLKQGHGNSMLQVEGQVKTSQEELARKGNELYELRVSAIHLITSKIIHQNPLLTHLPHKNN